MKTAKEMFEELGYEDVGDDEFKTMYSNGDYTNHRTIIFWKRWKQISINFDENDATIYFRELQAINKQVEELGWNE